MGNLTLQNLLEQFRRVANIYFLGLIILQVFPIFGAAAPQVAMLPLVVILLATGIKDGIEDSRRHALDNEVNNSAVTRLTGWINVNQPADSRSFFERMLGFSNPQTKITKGVKKLRAKEGSLHSDFLHPNPSELSMQNRDRSDARDDYSISIHGDGVASQPMRERSNTETSSTVGAPSYRSTRGQSGNQITS